MYIFCHLKAADIGKWRIENDELIFLNVKLTVSLSGLLSEEEDVLEE